MLGFSETARWIESKLDTCHPTNIESVKRDLQDARACKGQTLFEVIVEMIRDHGKGGSEEEDGVELLLE